jgi:ribosomal protein S18 acetylase RimI-like enzyme
VTEQILICRATGEDAPGISSIWQAVVAERDFSAVARAFTPEEERSYLESLNPREAVFAAAAEGQIVGFQTLDLWLRYMSSMDHVGQLGTFVRQEWRGRGIGRQLGQRTLAFARDNMYEKLVIFVRARNTSAQAFYKSLGFTECGRLVRQVKIANEYDDEILMEHFL